MASDSDLERTRRFAAGEVKRVLGIVDPTADRLFAKARTVLGVDRANRCLELARLAPLSRRWVPTSAIAGLVGGTVDLASEWWTNPHEELTERRQWTERGIPDTLLAAGHDDPETEDGGSCLAVLAGWIADDAADKQWGRPIDRVDVTNPRVDGRVVLPKGACAGDRLTAAFAPGGRVWVDVVERNADSAPGAVPQTVGPGRLGSRLAERAYHDVAQVRSAWSIATATGPIRLPGEMAGRSSDPFAAPVDHDVSRRLFDWVVANGVSAQQLGGRWRTKDALWTARYRLGLPYGRPGAWYTFDDAVAAVLDDERAVLAEALANLGI
jgi:hypothetical protein